jgi:hypothetical protein
MDDRDAVMDKSMHKIREVKHERTQETQCNQGKQQQLKQTNTNSQKNHSEKDMTAQIR